MSEDLPGSDVLRKAMIQAKDRQGIKMDPSEEAHYATHRPVPIPASNDSIYSTVDKDSVYKDR